VGTRDGPTEQIALPEFAAETAQDPPRSVGPVRTRTTDTPERGRSGPKAAPISRPVGRR